MRTDQLAPNWHGPATCQTSPYGVKVNADLGPCQAPAISPRSRCDGQFQYRLGDMGLHQYVIEPDTTNTSQHNFDSFWGSAVTLKLRPRVVSFLPSLPFPPNSQISSTCIYHLVDGRLLFLPRINFLQLRAACTEQQSIDFQQLLSRPNLVTVHQAQAPDPGKLQAAESTTIDSTDLRSTPQLCHQQMPFRSTGG